MKAKRDALEAKLRKADAMLSELETLKKVATK